MGSPSSKPSKPSIGTGATSRSKAALATAAAVLAKQLSDPKVRAQLIDQGTRLAQLTQTWRAERSVGNRVGPGKHNRRLTHLRTSVAGLAATRPELADELAPLVDNLDQIEFALTVADGLPLVKRTQARRRIDQELDRLEETVFEASLPPSP